MLNRDFTEFYEKLKNQLWINFLMVLWQTINSAINYSVAGSWPARRNSTILIQKSTILTPKSTFLTEKVNSGINYFVCVISRANLRINFLRNRDSTCFQHFFNFSRFQHFNSCIGPPGTQCY